MPTHSQTSHRHPRAHPAHRLSAQNLGSLKVHTGKESPTDVSPPSYNSGKSQ